jgi:hypothetical protein
LWLGRIRKSIYNRIYHKKNQESFVNTERLKIRWKDSLLNQFLKVLFVKYHLYMKIIESKRWKAVRRWI